MDFEFTAEQVAIRDTIRELVQDRVAPRAAEIDQKAEYPKDIEKLFADNGILGIPFPEEYGGISGSSVTICMGIEEIAKACASSSLILAVQALGSYPILVAGSEEQKKRLCPPLASGERVAAYALSESGSGSDAAAMRTRAIKHGNDYVLNGTKQFITHGSVAGTLVVFAQTDPAADHRGISAFVLERETSPWKIEKLEHKLGIRGSPTAQIVFEDVKVPAANRLGEEGAGFKIALAVLGRARPSPSGRRHPHRPRRRRRHLPRHRHLHHPRRHLHHRHRLPRPRARCRPATRNRRRRRRHLRLARRLLLTHGPRPERCGLSS